MCDLARHCEGPISSTVSGPSFFDGNTIIVDAKRLRLCEVLLQSRFTGEGDLRGQGHGHAMSEGLLPSTTPDVTLISARIVNVLLSSGTSMFALFRRREQLDRASCPGELFDEETIAVGANVADCVEVLLQLRFSGEEDACCQEHGHVPSA